MKVKAISRNPDHYLRETTRDIFKVQRNYDPELHPFEGLREYTRALNAVKLERVFAKPFVGNLHGHQDGVSCLGKHPSHLSSLVSGAYDGEVRLWDLPQQRCIRSFRAHDGNVRGITFVPDGSQFLTTGDDKTIKMWNTERPDWGEEEEPTNTYISKTVIMGISHHQRDSMFATCGEICQLWEEDRNEPVRTFQWGVDSIHDVNFNPVETHLLATCASDRSIILYDIRDTGPVRKVIMTLRCNKLCWNPMEAFIFTVANEDYKYIYLRMDFDGHFPPSSADLTVTLAAGGRRLSVDPPAARVTVVSADDGGKCPSKCILSLYTFDSRRLKAPMYVHMDHVSAVTSVDYAPTGKEFVSGGYDKAVRIFEHGKGHSRDIYHTKRMQRLTCVAWSMDNKYILCGSDEMNIRMWKARASEKLGVLRPREKAALNYNEALKQKFASHPQIKRIARHRQVPKHIYNAQKELRTIKLKQKQKEANRRAHSKPGTVPFVSEKKKHIVEEQE